MTMSTKLDADGLAAKWLSDQGMWPEQMSSRLNLGDTSPTLVEVFAMFAQPLADELATVKAERDELRALLEESQHSIGGDWRERRDTILTRYPKP